MKKVKLLSKTTAVLSAAAILTAAQAPALMADTTAAAAPASKAISVYVDGDAVSFDVAPTVRSQRVLVPLRAVCEAMGARVEWAQESQTIYMYKRDRYISMPLGQSVMYVNGESYTLEVPSTAENGRTLVPLRAVSEAMNADVQWVQKDQSVVITGNHGDHVIHDLWQSYTVKDQPSGKTLYTEHTVYPVLKNADNQSAIANINAVCKKAVDDVIDTNEQELIEAAQDMLDEGINYPTALDMELTVPYDQKDLLSVRYVISMNLGGAHPSSYLETYNFDTKTGKVLTLGDVLGCTQEQALQNVRHAFAKAIQAEPDAFFEEAPETAKTLTFNDFTWHLTDKGIVAEAQLYVLTPYAAGYPSVTLSYPVQD